MVEQLEILSHSTLKDYLTILMHTGGYYPFLLPYFGGKYCFMKSF